LSSEIRNGNKEYSKKLNKNIQTTINLIAINPFLGRKSDFENIRVFVLKTYKIFYQVENDAITIHLIWDTRQNHDKLSSFLT
jgi:plasmid stabilization system protein ParE